MIVPRLAPRIVDRALVRQRIASAIRAERENRLALPAECFPTAAIWLAPAVCRLCHCSPSCKGHCTSLCRSLSRCKNGPLDSFWLPGPCAPDSSIRGTSCPMLSAFPCTTGSLDWQHTTLLFSGMTLIDWATIPSVPGQLYFDARSIAIWEHLAPGRGRANLRSILSTISD